MVAEVGVEPAHGVRSAPPLRGAGITGEGFLESQTTAAADSSWDADDPFAVAIPFAKLGKHTGDAIELALVVSREGRDIEVVPPSGALGVRVPGQARAVEVEHAKHLRVLVATAELAPFAKLGGVSDVAASLSKELRRIGHDVRVVLPRYRQVDIGRFGLHPVATDVKVPLGTDIMAATIYESRLNELVVYFVDCPPLYDRDGMFGFGDDD